MPGLQASRKQFASFFFQSNLAGVIKRHELEIRSYNILTDKRNATSKFHVMFNKEK